MCVPGQAVEGVMYAYPITSLPRQSPALIVEKALKRTNRTGTQYTPTHLHTVVYVCTSTL